MNNGEKLTVNIGLVQRPVPPVRDHFDEAELARLTQSIRDEGILQPLLVVRRDDKYEVVDGDRRLKAAWEAGLREVPVLVRDLSDEQVHIHRMLANLDRHDPDPVSEAKYIATLVATQNWSVEDVAKKLGRSMAWVEGRLTIAEMPDYMREALRSGDLSLGVAMELHSIKDENTKQRYTREAIHSGMTVHAAKVSALTVNEAITAIRERGEEVTEETTPAPVFIPKVKCAITGEVLPQTETLLIRVGKENYQRFMDSMRASESG